MSNQSDRRQFLGLCVVTGAGAMLGGIPAKLCRAAEEASKQKGNAESYEAFCGVSCSSECSVYKAVHENDVEEKKRIAEGWTKLLGRPVSADDVCCEGCKAEGCHGAWCAEKCSLRPCAEKKGVQTCAHCEEYPCEKSLAEANKWTRKRLDEIHRSLS